MGNKNEKSTKWDLVVLNYLLIKSLFKHGLIENT